MTKKHPTSQPHKYVSKHAQSRIERDARRRRIITIAGSVFLGVVAIVVVVGLYVDHVKPMNEPVLKVNSRTFTMSDYIETLEVYATNMDKSQLNSITGMVMSQMARDEIVRQAALSEGIVIGNDTVKAQINELGLPDNDAIRDSIRASLAQEEVQSRLLALMPTEMEQVRFDIMLTESRAVAEEARGQLVGGSAIADLVEGYSASPTIPSTQDWVPVDLLANNDVKNACTTLNPGSISLIRDTEIAKPMGYWLIELVDKDDQGAIKPRAMLLSSEQEALEAKARLAAEDFVDVAAELSQFYGADELAELEWVGPEDTVTAAFNEAAFALADLNIVSEPILDKEVQTQGGYWMVRLLERGVQPLSEQHRQALASTAFSEWYATYSETAVIEELITPDQMIWAVARAAE
ncbi:peptidylprolyl isomerase [Chloroflexota bacterium]